jgi:hypothetical protein
MIAPHPRGLIDQRKLDVAQSSRLGRWRGGRTGRLSVSTYG